MVEEENNNKLTAEQLKFIQEELSKLQKQQSERYPSLSFNENIITEFDFDTTRQVGEWVERNETGAIIKYKKIFPVIYQKQKCSWWLNVKNPAYTTLLQLLAAKITHFRVLQVGSKEKTRYAFVK